MWELVCGAMLRVFLTVDTFRPTTVLRMNTLALPAGDRVAIIDNAGDLNVLAADAAAAAKLQIVELSAAFQMTGMQESTSKRGLCASPE